METTKGEPDRHDASVDGVGVVSTDSAVSRGTMNPTTRDVEPSLWFIATQCRRNDNRRDVALG